MKTFTPQTLRGSMPLMASTLEFVAPKKKE